MLQKDLVGLAELLLIAQHEIPEYFVSPKKASTSSAVLRATNLLCIQTKEGQSCTQRKTNLLNEG